MKISKTALPDKTGHFGRFGGRFVIETLRPALVELTREYASAKRDPKFRHQLAHYRKSFIGRPTPLYFAERMTKHFGGAKIFIKREDLAHTGAHKINNTVGQGLLTLRMGKKRVIAETGAGQHGVATATVAALFGLKCEVYMGEEDIERQRLNVFRMHLLGANVIPVSSGTKTLKDATNEALRDWIASVRDTHYIIGSVVGPHPYPMMVRDFQSVIGEETKKQFAALHGGKPDYLIACVGGGSNSIGLFHPFYKDSKVKMVGVEAAGHGIKTGWHGASITAGEVGVLHGSKMYLLMTKDGQVKETHSVSAGLDYPGVGPEHCFYKESGRAEYVSITDKEALDAFQLFARLEGIVPALESSHAIAYAAKLARKLSKSKTIVVNLSGRGDKDAAHVADILGK